jgi:phosphoglycerate dehydrogenase-like enzyme
VARTLRIEYDATRLNAAAVTKLVREAGLDIAEEEPLLPAAVPVAALPPTV